MSLLDICQNAAGYAPVDEPSSIVGNANQTARSLLTYAKREGEQLYRRHTWTFLTKEYEFSTVASQRDYNLPSDFGWLINQTAWDRTNFWEMRGPLTPVEWQIYRSSVLSDTVSSRKRFRIWQTTGTKKFYIDPLPDSVDNLVFEYVSNQWCESSVGTPQTTWLADTDVGRLDEHLIELGVTWRLLNRLGMAYAEERDEYDKEVSAAIGRDGGAPVLQTNRRHKYFFISPWNAPDTGYGP